MNRSKRIAALMSSAAVTVFLLVLATTSETVSARRCQEECNAEKAAGQAECDQLQQSDPEASVNDCYQLVNQQFNSCSVNATSCSQAYQCSVDISCNRVCEWWDDFGTWSCWYDSCGVSHSYCF
jgi:hypothetical protein